MSYKKLRIRYFVAFVILLLVEIAIALWVHDDFIRPYVGDVLVVMVIYCAIRVVIPAKYKAMPLMVFLFAAGVECLQYFNLVKILGLQHSTFWRILIGSTFDMKDILCYGVGCIVLSLYEMKGKS